MEAAELAGLLAEPDRLRVVAALALGAGTLEAVRDATGLDLRDLRRAVARLEAAGLVETSDRDLVLRWELVRDAARLAGQRPHEDHGSQDSAVESVLRRFLRDGRITQVPMARSKRLVVLDHVSRVFEIGVRYPEKEVDALIRSFYDDYAAIRRYLVDEGFLTREHGVYWRSGGSVDL